MFKTKELAKAVRFALLGGAVATAMTSLPVLAAEGEEVERIEVTGSRIKRTDLEGASPVVVVSADDIIKGGFSSVQDVLGSMSQNSGGSLDQQQTFGFTPAASGVNLRGAGLGRSLTLINGKRLPKYPIPSGGTDNFVDTANIPIGAIERIEILTSGASAIYGSDAMGGVINIILKKDYQGVQVTARAGDTSEGGGETSRTSLLAGSSSDKGNITFFTEYDKRKSIEAADREKYTLHTDKAWNHPFSAYSSYGRNLREYNTAATVGTLNEADCLANGEGYLFTGGSCRFDRSTMRQLLPDQERFSSLVNFDYEVADGHQVYGRMDYTYSNVARSIESMPIGQDDIDFFVEEVDGARQLRVVNPYSGGQERVFTDLATAFGGDFAGLDVGRYFYTHRATEFGPRYEEIENDSGTVLLGFKGVVFDDYDYDANWMFSKQRVTSWGTGYAAANVFYDVVTRGNGHSLLNDFSEEQVEEMAYTSYTDASSTLTGLQSTVSGEMFELPAGAVGFAVGAEMYREWFVNTSDSESQAGRVLTTGGASGAGGRDYWSLYGETAIPIVEGLTTTLALRYDDFSDFGNNIAPQIALEYRPIDDLLLRALWAETFRAPDMQRVYGDPTTGFEQIIDYKGCTDAGGRPGNPDDPLAVCNGEHYITSLTGPNKDLDAETGQNWNVGAVYAWNDLTLSVDIWNVQIDDIINDISAQTIAQEYEEYADLIVRDPVTGYITDINSTAQNLSSQETAGIDWSVDYDFGEYSFGEFTAGLSGTYLTKWDEQVSQTSRVSDELEESRIPKWRWNATTSWSYGDWSANMLITYVGKMKGTNQYDFENEYGYTPTDLGVPTFEVKEHVEVNLSAKYYVLPSLSIQAGVNNLFNQGPEVDWTDNEWPHFAQDYHNPVGRSYYLQGEYSF